MSRPLIPNHRNHQILIPNCASPEAGRWRSVEFIFRLSKIDHGGGKRPGGELLAGAAVP